MHNDCLCCIHKCCRRTVFARHKYFSMLDNNSRLKTIDSFQFPNLSATALSAIVNKNLALWFMLVQKQLKIGNLKANWINNTWLTLSTQTVGVRWVVVEMSDQKYLRFMRSLSSSTTRYFLAAAKSHPSPLCGPALR